MKTKRKKKSIKKIKKYKRLGKGLFSKKSKKKIQAPEAPKAPKAPEVPVTIHHTLSEKNKPVRPKNKPFTLLQIDKRSNPLFLPPSYTQIIDPDKFSEFMIKINEKRRHYFELKDLEMKEKTLNFKLNKIFQYINSLNSYIHLYIPVDNDTIFNEAHEELEELKSVLNLTKQNIVDNRKDIEKINEKLETIEKELKSTYKSYYDDYNKISELLVS